MSIRYALEHEKKIIKQMWIDNFPEEKQSYIDFYFDACYQSKHCLVNEEDGQIVSSLQMNPHQIKMNQVLIGATMIAGVCTNKQNRGVGYMRELMEAALELIAQKNKMVMMHSTNPSLYYRFGFEDAYVKSHYLLTAPILTKFSTAYRVDTLGPQHTSSLVRVYADFCQHKEGSTLRDEMYFKHLITSVEIEEGHILGCFNGADMMGYACYKMIGGKVVSSEIIYQNEEALLTMIKVLSNKSNVLQITLDYNTILNQEVDVSKKIDRPYLLVKLLNKKAISLLMNKEIKHVKDLLGSNAFISEEI